ncbi:MAG: glycosyltransferase family 2 protein [Comamonas sp.]|jgi:glycosyltransferase involved in cell wall biosynthesis
MKKNSKAAILLSTFNGAEFLSEQLNSLVNQSHSDIEIFVRDDGSVDETIEIIEVYKNRCKNIHLVKGENIGFIKSFFELLRISGNEFDYYFFCDQDDVWLENKVSRAICLLSEIDADKPSLYFSRLQFVDKELNFLRMSDIYEKRNIGFGNAMVQNIATGCSVCFNKKARYLVTENEFPDNCLAHDWWMYLVVSCFGKVVFDEESFILYRQHGKNTIGMSATGFFSYFKRGRKFLKNRKKFGIIDQMQIFFSIYKNHLLPRTLKNVEEFCNVRNRWRNSFTVGFRRFYWRVLPVDSIFLRIFIIFRMY